MMNAKRKTNIFYLIIVFLSFPMFILFLALASCSHHEVNHRNTLFKWSDDNYGITTAFANNSIYYLSDNSIHRIKEDNTDEIIHSIDKGFFENLFYNNNSIISTINVSAEDYSRIISFNVKNFHSDKFELLIPKSSNMAVNTNVNILYGIGDNYLAEIETRLGKSIFDLSSNEYLFSVLESYNFKYSKEINYNGKYIYWLQNDLYIIIIEERKSYKGINDYFNNTNFIRIFSVDTGNEIMSNINCQSYNEDNSLISTIQGIYDKLKNRVLFIENQNQLVEINPDTGYNILSTSLTDNNKPHILCLYDEKLIIFYEDNNFKYVCCYDVLSKNIKRISLNNSSVFVGARDDNIVIYNDKEIFRIDLNSWSIHSVCRIKEIPKNLYIEMCDNRIFIYNIEDNGNYSIKEIIEI